MTGVAEFPDVLVWLKGYLGPILQRNGYPDAHVSDKYRGDSVEVWLQHDGGSTLDVRRAARTVRVNVFHDQNVGPDEADPVDALAERVSTLIRLAPLTAEGAVVSKVQQIAGPLHVPGPKPQRYLLFELVLIGQTASLV